MTDINIKTPLDMIIIPFEPLDTGNFWFALFVAPLAVGLFGIFLVIPPFAVIFGYLPYLILGTPAFWVVLKVAKTPFHRILGLMIAGFAVNFLTAPLYAWYYDAPLERYEFVTMMGMIFAPLWAGVMGYLYTRWSRNVPDMNNRQSRSWNWTTMSPKRINKGASI